MSIEAMKDALITLVFARGSIEDWGGYASDYFQNKHDLKGDISKVDKAITSLRQAIEQAEKQEPWVWMPAPIKTQWGHDMVVADLAIDKAHTVSVYCERDQTEKVEAMFRGKNT